MSHLPQRYTAEARWLHWLMALLVVLAYSLILSRSLFGHGTPWRQLIMEGHFWTGIVILVLAIRRLWVRRRHPPPPVTPPLGPLLDKTTRLTHLALYLFMFIQPILGIATVWLSQGAIPIPLADAAIPSPLPVSHDAAELVESCHVLLGTLFYYVIGLHVAAALWHHFIRRDGLLRRMT